MPELLPIPWTADAAIDLVAMVELAIGKPCWKCGRPLCRDEGIEIVGRGEIYHSRCK
jgi:hypothetical protein